MKCNDYMEEHRGVFPVDDTVLWCGLFECMYHDRMSMSQVARFFESRDQLLDGDWMSMTVNREQNFISFHEGKYVIYFTRLNNESPYSTLFSDRTRICQVSFEGTKLMSFQNKREVDYVR